MRTRAAHLKLSSGLFSAFLMASVVFFSSFEAQAQNRCSILLSKYFRELSAQTQTVVDLVKPRPATPRPLKLAPEKAYLFGLEFTVTNQTIVNEGNRNPKDYSLGNNPIKAQALYKFWEMLAEKCQAHPGCTSTMTRDKHDQALRLQFEDGFYFTVGNDSAVIEINAKPQTIDGFSKVKHYLDDFVFDIAKQIELKPHQRAGQGHIHVSKAALNNDARLLRNFFVDFQNRPEIVYGALGNHLLNSPPLAAEKPHQREGLRELLNTLDKKGRYSIEDFVNGIHRQVYTSSHAGDWGNYDYYQAFNMTRLLKSESSATIEIRSFRPQRNTREFELQTRLLSRWIEHLRTRETPVEYNMADRYEYSNQEIVDGYYKLIRELSLPWNEFKYLLPENLMNFNPTGMQ